MKKLFFTLMIVQCCVTASFSQSNNKNIAANFWADSVLNSLTPEQRIAQLMVLRLSSYDFNTRTPIYYDSLVAAMVKQYNVGGVCLFQGNPVKLSSILNDLQGMAQTPIMVCIDAEWGVGMRLIDSVQALPHQMMLGAVQDSNIIYQYGKLVAEQCKRLGIHVNYAPVVDVNNNPNNPVINDRSFGEDKYKVASYGIQYMKGMQDAGVMACAKHFPGHGDVAVDSHLDLPVINKSLAQLDSLELYPFRKIFNAGISSVMIAHLYIPAIDSTPNRATSISKNNVTGLMRNNLGYQGLTFTDALEMQGVKKFYPDGDASVQSLIAGNDMLCLPGDVEMSINKIKAAIKNKQLTWDEINQHCKKVLLAKYQYVNTNISPINLVNITSDLNNGIPAMKKLVAENAITVLNKVTGAFEADLTAADEIAYVGIGLSSDNTFAQQMRTNYNAGVFNFNYKQDAGRIASTLELIKTKYKKVIIGIHAYARTPAKNFGISSYAINLVNQLQEQNNCLTFVFGNPYAIKNFCGAKNLVACYEDDAITQEAAANFLLGRFTAKGTLPVTICEQYKFGDGIKGAGFHLPKANIIEQGINVTILNEIESIANNAIEKGATPGCVVLVVKDGKIAFHKAYGYFDYDKKEKVSTSSVYDMASVTKICATTIAVMKLYDEGKIDLKKTLGDYLSVTAGTDKARLTIENILLHQAGLAPFIPFYKETSDPAGTILSKYYRAQQNDSFNVRVAENLFEQNGWPDTMMLRIMQSPLGAANKYVYSDNDFILLGKIIEAITGMGLDKYVQKEFYQPLGLNTAGFKPRQYLPLASIAPTENEPTFRKQLIRGDVHDPGAAMFGGVAGHAGLFSSAYDISIIMQMLMNGGTFNGKRYLQKETVDLFTGYHSDISRRGYGFDKPEKDNATKAEPYPCLSSSPLTFGHTGFTGTCTWADPAKNLVYVFLSNRVSPKGDNLLLGKMNVRPTIHEIIYKALVNQ
jgi:beta-glucosidase-like glycosyl hydrolase/CubicO group peptidase (beta-lactamase class C family)